MSLQFEKGDPAKPLGHAIIYFTDRDDPHSAGATYVVLLPVLVDMAKYVPPFLAGQIEALGDPDLSSFAFPPAPEPVKSVEWVRNLADARGDDLIFGGSANLKDTAGLMGVVGQIAAEYGRLYEESTKSAAESEPPAAPELPEVDDVVYGMMSEADLLSEVTTLVGRLRFAIEGRDTGTAREAEAKIRAIGRNLPENRQIALLADAAISAQSTGAKLAQLYLERAYGLLREDYRRVQAVEEQIREITAG
jgi:hypothetical protein